MIYSYFEKLFYEGKIVQSFLIGNEFYANIKDDLNKTINSFIFSNCNLDIENNPDVYILKIDDNIIGKDDIKELLKNISTTSQFNSSKVYIIDQCEKLNEFACNALLKTLEEPENGIYAFLITTNMDNVKSTIVSRCQKIFINSSINYMNFNNNFEENVEKICSNFINSIEKNNVLAISRNYDLYSLITDRSLLQNVLKRMLYKYDDALNNKIKNIDSDDIIIQNNSTLTISKKMLVINDNINYLNSYLNKNLCIDRFIIDMWRCHNENSRG